MQPLPPHPGLQIRSAPDFGSSGAPQTVEEAPEVPVHAIRGGHGANRRCRSDLYPVGHVFRAEVRRPQCGG